MTCVFLACTACSAKTRTLPREVFGPPVPLEAKSALIAAIVNRAATGGQLRNRASNLFSSLRREGQQAAAGGLGGLGGGRGGMSLQQRLGQMRPGPGR